MVSIELRAEPVLEPDVPATDFGNMEPVGWLESPHGAFQRNFNLRCTFPPKSVKWSIPVYFYAPQRLAKPVQEPVAWTPVAEALPKSGVKVLACYRNRLGNLRRIRAQWVAAKTEEVCGDADDWGEYDEEADCYWTPQGWYECIDNWGDYSSVAVTEGEVTHWMPLPPDPSTTPPQRPAEPLEPTGCDHCRHPLHVATQCRVCGRVTA